MQPINYMLDVQSPIQTALAGYMQGKQFRAQEQGMEMQRQQFDMQKQQFEAAQAQIAQQQARAQEVQGMMAQLAERFASDDPPTAQEFAQLQILVPEMAESIGNAWGTLSEQQKEAKIQERARVAIALATDPQSAMQMFDQKILAAENSGDTDLAAQLKASKAQAELFPEAALTALTAELAFILDPEQFDNFMSRLVPPKSELRETVLGTETVLYDPTSPDAKSTIQVLGAAPERPAGQGFGISFDKDGNIIYVGSGAAEAAKVPPGYGRVPDPNSPTGTRLVAEPGGPVESAQGAAIATADDVIKTLQELKTSKGAPNRYGMASVGGIIPAIPGSKEANAQAIINKVKGAAFLQAFETLKGGGQITQIEGEKATAAITVLQDQNISWEFALKAADELIGIVKAAKARKAKGETVSPAAQAPASGNLPTVRSDAEYEALTSGSEFVGSDGKRYRKP